MYKLTKQRWNEIYSWGYTHFLVVIPCVVCFLSLFLLVWSVCVSAFETVRVWVWVREHSVHICIIYIVYTFAVRPSNDAFTAHIALIRWQSGAMHVYYAPVACFTFQTTNTVVGFSKHDTHIHTSRLIRSAVRYGRISASQLNKWNFEGFVLHWCQKTD